MSTPLSPATRNKRLLVILAVGVCVLVAAWWNSQARHMGQAKRHIDAIEPQWREFQATHPGLEKIELFVYTGKDGAIGVYGNVGERRLIEEIQAFLEGTHPPRPVAMMVSVEEAETEKNP